MIIDLNKTSDLISNWIKDYATRAGAKALVIGLSGGIDSACTALLCKRTGIRTICVGMPCHSSPSAIQRALLFANDFNIKFGVINLNYSHDSITMDAKDHFSDMDSSQFVKGCLSSCLRAPTLSYIAHGYNGLIVGTGNRSEDNLTRFYQKYGDGLCDLAPIADLFKIEIYQLFAHLSELKPTARAIYDAKPSADLLGPDSGQDDETDLGMTYDEIEWADREDMVSGIIKNPSDPTRSPIFLRFTGRQKAVICKLHQMEKISRHKVNPNLPVCLIRDRKDLVR